MFVHLLFFFSALGIFNAFIVGCYFLFYKKTQHISDIFLGILLLLLSIRVGISCSYYFGSISFSFIKIGLTAHLLLGPTLLFRSLVGTISKDQLIKDYMFHISCILLGISICWIFVDFNGWDTIIRFIIHGVLTLYLLFTGIKLQKEIQLFIASKTDILNNKESIILFVAIILVCFGFVISLMTTYILGPLVFSVVFYLIFSYFLINKERIQTKKTNRKKWEAHQFESIKEKLIHAMETEKIYKNTELNLDVLANRIGTNRHLLSQILNTNLQKNFYQYINEYRIAEACSILVSKQPYSVESIGYEVGFRSKSAFFSTFKKIKGTTPSKYKDLHSTPK